MTEAAESVALGSWPTPLEPARRLSVALGLRPADLWIKRDDLTGLGGGGNKVRKLQWTCGEAVAAGADTLVTSGAAQSNHARLTAAAGARLGLEVVLVLAGDQSAAAAGNLALDGLLGARVVWAGQVDDKALGSVAVQTVAQLRDRGKRPALIPFGGSSVVGARGYVEAGQELLEQAPDLATVVVAVGSGGTMAGLVHVLGSNRVLGVHCGAIGDPAEAVGSLVTGLGDSAAARGALRIRLDQVGDGYSALTEPVLDALLLTARTEGIILDPIYTGRAMAGLVSAVREGEIKPGERTIFLHTGGLPGLFGHPVTVARGGASLGDFELGC